MKLIGVSLLFSAGVSLLFHGTGFNSSIIMGAFFLTFGVVFCIGSISAEDGQVEYDEEVCDECDEEDECIDCRH